MWMACKERSFKVLVSIPREKPFKLCKFIIGRELGFLSAAYFFGAWQQSSWRSLDCFLGASFTICTTGCGVGSKTSSTLFARSFTTEGVRKIPDLFKDSTNKMLNPSSNFKVGLFVKSGVVLSLSFENLGSERVCEVWLLSPSRPQSSSSSFLRIILLTVKKVRISMSSSSIGL